MIIPERWFKFSMLEQMANIGCDIDRAIRWRNKGECEVSVGVFERALEMLDLTIADPKNKGGRLRELTRLREFLKDYFLCGNQYQVLDDTFLYNYFMDFSYAAALQRGR
ncbi:MAG TPA: hypothetical protein VGT41_05095 [Candidatus Babeliales bacterium]|nr:hypothetical protein [Candidatus Babeliales bacterium]